MHNLCLIMLAIKTIFIDLLRITLPKPLVQFQPHSLMGEGFMGGCTPPPFPIIFDFRLRSLRYEKDFLPVLSKLSQASMVKIFHFSDERKVISVAPQRGGGYTPP